MRITLIHPHLFVKGGGERLAKILVLGLKNFGDEISVLTSSLDHDFFKVEDVKVFPIKKLSLNFGSVMLNSLTSIAYSIKGLIDEFNPEIVISMTEDLVNLGICKLLKKEVKTIQYVHFPVEEEAKTVYSDVYLEYFRFPEWFNKSFLWAADKILCNSNYTKKAIKKFWGLNSEVVYPALDPIFMQPPKNLGKPRENIVLCAGRFTKLKRQDFLVKIFPKIKQKILDAKLVLAGFPDERHKEFYDKLLVEASKNKGIEIYSNPSDEELFKLYSKAKVFCHPRIGEHFGLTIVEAMSQGVPVVAYNSGGVKETITHGKNGFLANNDEEFLRYIIKVLSLKDVEWLKMQKAGIKKAKMFSPTRFTEKIRKIIQKI
ncbi:glycosyltransferase family 1 protein [Candidatus Bathyarchaeota archaeon]|nr:MAG: glycosyltransferase family 1 protein [Candidatus Bathyarchaeota archaeon]